jgi:hypothetical protein
MNPSPGWLPVTRRHFTRLLFLASLARCGAGEPRPLQLRVEAEPFGASAADILAVLRSAADEIWRHCPQTHFEQPGLAIYRHEKYPITHFEPSEDGWIVIGLATEKTYWAQYAYQFAHEFGHALAGHANDWRRIWRTARHANQWLEEALCETASLFTLRAMAKTWETAPPYPHWKSYAPALAHYAAERLDQPAHRLAEGKKFADWFRENEPALRANGTDRGKNTLIAAQLLPLFEAEPHGWETLPALNLGRREPDKPLRRHLAEWQSQTAAELRPFVAKLAQLLVV